MNGQIGLITFPSCEGWETPVSIFFFPLHHVLVHLAFKVVFRVMYMYVFGCILWIYWSINL